MEKPEAVREVLESYKHKIHGSEYDYHSKHCSFDEHNEYMRVAQYQALTAIEAEISKRKEEWKKEVDKELLEACKEALETLEFIKDYEPRPRNATNRLRQVITKAEEE